VKSFVFEAGVNSRPWFSATSRRPVEAWTTSTPQNERSAARDEWMMRSTRRSRFRGLGGLSRGTGCTRGEQ